MDTPIIPSTQPNTSPLMPTAPRAYPLMPGAEPFLYKASSEVGLVLVHGFTAAPSEMRDIARHLADRGITVSAPLLAGHGTSPEDLERTTWQDWFASVNAAVDEMRARCKRVYLGGLSLGGALTLYTAAQRGQDLAGIIVMSAPIYLPTPLGYALKGIKRGMPYLYKPFRDVEDPEARERHISYSHSPVAALASLVDFLGHVRGSLSQIDLPALIIYARRDHVVPFVSSHHIYSRLARSISACSPFIAASIWSLLTQTGIRSTLLYMSL